MATYKTANEQERKEQLEKIITELRGNEAFKLFKQALRNKYDERWSTYNSLMQDFKQNELPEKEKIWRKSLTVILNNFDKISKYLDNGQVDLESCTDFIQKLETNYSDLLKSSTLRRTFNKYKQRLENFINNSKGRVKQ